MLKVAWLQTCLALPNKMPSHDPFGRVVAALDPMAFAEGFPLRQSFDTASAKAAIPRVSASASHNHLRLRQVKTEAKSTEITAIPPLSKLLELQGSYCHITRQIMNQEADYYVVALAQSQLSSPLWRLP